MTTRKKSRKPAAGKKLDAAYAEFMARAYVMEVDASERYADFADQMEVHNNIEVAQLFRKLSRIEGLHAKRILQEMGWKQPPRALLAWRWDDAEPPETAAVTDLHYLMQPWHALEIGLKNERRAQRFFERLMRSASIPAAVKKVAAEMAEEEREHVRLILDWMKRVPKPEPGWDRDPDPPVYSD
jgi:rubrerythrin